MKKIINLGLAKSIKFENSNNKFVNLIWFITEVLIIDNRLMPVSRVRVAILRFFGAKIGRNCRFLHAIRVKTPWNLEVGDNSWIGEDVWIYNQDKIKIGSDVCISQGCFLTTGSHDAVDTMDLKVAPIIIEDGAWISSKCVVQMGVIIGRSAVVTPLSVVHKSLEAEGIYGGNPAQFIRKRFPSSS